MSQLTSIIDTSPSKCIVGEPSPWGAEYTLWDCDCSECCKLQEDASDPEEQS